MPKPTDVRTMEKVRALLASGVGVNEVARQVGMSPSGVSGLKKQFEKDDSFAQERTDQKKEFIRLAWQAARTGIQIVNDKLAYIAQDEDLKRSTDMREITTSVGTMIDKARLASGEATQIVDGNVKLTKFEDL